VPSRLPTIGFRGRETFFFRRIRLLSRLRASIADSIVLIRRACTLRCVRGVLYSIVHTADTLVVSGGVATGTLGTGVETRCVNKRWWLWNKARNYSE